ncbi:MAG: ATP-binding cassette domain-containing protein [Rubellimicrobium sp.]|nr:ATP-binding cassette domain-containing protein [Rubellimicrobium sp.]
MIRLRGITRSFGANRVLAGVDLDVGRGESVVVIGGSGSGKSVLVKCILGLVRPDAGSVLIDGAELRDRHARDAFLARAGVLFQGGALFDSLPVWQNVAFRFLRGPRALPRAQARALAVERLARVGLAADVADRLPAELSGGMQKRVGLARAIAADPEMIFFDEPTTGLDPIMSGVINTLIRSIQREIGATAITITHDMTSVRAIADRVAMLHDGVIRWTGTVAEMDATSDPYVAQFIRGAAEGPIRALR